jgi:hypothetical protein
MVSSGRVRIVSHEKESPNRPSFLVPLTGLEPARPRGHRPSTCRVFQFRHRGSETYYIPPPVLCQPAADTRCALRWMAFLRSGSGRAWMRGFGCLDDSDTLILPRRSERSEECLLTFFPSSGHGGGGAARAGGTRVVTPVVQPCPFWHRTLDAGRDCRGGWVRVPVSSFATLLNPGLDKQSAMTYNVDGNGNYSQ